MQRKFLKFKRRTAAAQRKQVRKFKRLSRHPVLVPIATFAVLILVSGGLYVGLSRGEAAGRNARVVIITQDGKEQIVPSDQTTVGALIKKLDIKIGEGDRVEPALDTKIAQDDFRVNIYKAVPVKVIDGERQVFAFSAGTTPRAVAKQTGAELYPEDRVITTPVANFLKDGAIGQQVVVDRATPVNVNLYGTPEVLRTHAKTVGELLKEKGIKLTGDDQVLPAAETPLTENQQVFIARTGTTIQSVNEAIAMPVQVINDPNLAYGTSAVRQQGSAGQRVVTYEVELRNGIAVSRKVIQSVVTQEAVIQVEVRGASLSGIKGDMARAGIAASDFNYVDYIVTKESRWNPTARNASSGAYGLCQALPGSKMASAGSDWSSNPVTQLRWCDGYAKSRYGSWASAYSFWLRNHYW